MDERPPKTITILKRIAEHCKDIDNSIEYFGNSVDVFQSNKIYRDVCCMYVAQIGELSCHLTDEFKQAFDEISWKDIETLSNVFGNNSSGSLVWSAIHEEMPKLAGFCEKVIMQYYAIIKAVPDEGLDELYDDDWDEDADDVKRTQLFIDQ
ncbi:MAG: hypothetical protein LBT59_11470 [Clostridiales bacterium]|jgi:uncharacterized protein with HEPN domain|nr:hypothetical protein [Clostridiales bacterium]